MILFVVSTFVAVPLEESFFRGVIQRRLEETFHSTVAIGLASLCFTTVHTGVSVGTGGELIALGLFFAVSVVLGVSYTVTDTDRQKYVNSYLHTNLEQRTRRTVRQDSDERPGTSATRRRYWRAKIPQIFVRQYENLYVPVIGHAIFNGTQILVRALEVLV